MVYYSHRRINWASAAILIIAAGCFVALGLATDSGGARITMWVVAAIALLSLLTSVTITVKVTEDSIVITQGAWATADSIPLADIAGTSITPIPFMRRFGRAWLMDKQEVITAGDAQGVEVWLGVPKRSRFFRAMVDRTVIGSNNPQALQEAIERARAAAA